VIVSLSGRAEASLITPVGAKGRSMLRGNPGLAISEGRGGPGAGQVRNDDQSQERQASESLAQPERLTLYPRHEGQVPIRIN
jgi:hypothetical protein